MEKQGKTGRYMVFIELAKACDRVPRQEVWRRNREKGLPCNYVLIVQDMHEGARTRAKTNVGPTYVRDHAWHYYWNTQTEHCCTSLALSTTEHQRVALVKLEALLKSGAIRSFLDTDGQKSGSYRRGWVPRRKNWHSGNHDDLRHQAKFDANTTIWIQHLSY